jgi:hypothetical protein
MRLQALRDATWQVVDASQSIDEVHAQLARAASAAVERCRAGNAPLHALWAPRMGGEPLAEIDNVVDRKLGGGLNLI